MRFKQIKWQKAETTSSGMTKMVGNTPMGDFIITWRMVGASPVPFLEETPWDKDLGKMFATGQDVTRACDAMWMAKLGEFLE